MNDKDNTSSIKKINETHDLLDDKNREALIRNMSQATGSSNPVFSALIYTACTSACSSLLQKKDFKADLESGIIDALRALKPQDEVEGMLVTRLIALHTKSMEYLALSHCEGQTSFGVDANINRSTKLMRLYNETLETMTRYRRKGEQRITVQHVNVNDGGRAIIHGSGSQQ